jgi:hypothetical protein
MREQFAGNEGTEGYRRSVEAFGNQEIVDDDNDVARKLADEAIVEELKQKQTLYHEGEPGKKFMFSVVSGRCEVSVKGKLLAILGSGQALGEFPILDPDLTTPLPSPRGNRVWLPKYQSTYLCRSQMSIQRYGKTWLRCSFIVCSRVIACITRARRKFGPDLIDVLIILILATALNIFVFSMATQYNRTLRSAVAHSGSPALRRPSSYLARSSGRRNGCTRLISEIRNVGSIWRSRAAAFCA